MSRTAMGLTQPPIQWAVGVLSLGVERPTREAEHSPPPNAEVNECVELYIHSPNMSSWCSTQLSTGPTLPLPYFIVYLKNILYNFGKNENIKNKLIPKISFENNSI
jgi:hypothetical protein